MQANPASNPFPTQDDSSEAPSALADFVRIPGVLFSWEISQVFTSETEFFIEHAGMLDEVDVFRVYQRKPKRTTLPGDDDVGLAVSLTFEGEATPIPARLLPMDSADPLTGVLVLGKGDAAGAVLTRIRDYLNRQQQPPVNRARAARAVAAAKAARGSR